MRDIFDEAIDLDSALTLAEQKGEDFNRREAAFSWDPTSYASIDAIRASSRTFMTFGPCMLTLITM